MNQDATVKGRRNSTAGAMVSVVGASRVHPRDWPFRVKTGLVMVAIGLVPAILVALLLIWQANQQQVTARNTATLAVAEDATTAASMLLASNLATVQQIAGSPSIGGLFGTADYSGLDTLLTTLVIPTHGGVLSVVNRAGSIVAASQAALVGHSAANLLATQQALHGQGASVTLEPVLAGQTPMVIAAAPLLRHTRINGAVLAQWDAGDLHAVLAPSGAYLLLPDGRIVAGLASGNSAPALLYGGASQAAGVQVPAFSVLHGSPFTRLADGSVAGALTGDNASVLVVPPVGTQDSLLGQSLVRQALLLVLVLTVLVALLATMALTRPLTVLARTLAAVRAGNYGSRVQLPQHDEIGVIGSTVDMLIERTQTLVTDLENQRLELENGIIQLFTELAEAASGNLTVRPTMSEGPLGAVADSVRILLERFGATVMGIQATASAVTVGTSQLAATVLGVSQEAQKQATQLAQGAEAIAEMASTAQIVSQRTRAATDVAMEAVNAVESGNHAVTNAREAAKRTSETSRRAARQVKSLGESAQLMGNALLLVQHNTEELHLVAGNASIEAARYAESGGVFRTVADSIEQLALQSQGALRQIQSVVENTQRETARVVAAIEEVTAEVMTVARVIDLAGENFDTINHIVKGLADLNLFIASASEQQARMAVDMAEMISNLNQVSLQTSANTALSAQAAVHLRQLTEQLNDSVSTLKVS